MRGRIARLVRLAAERRRREVRRVRLEERRAERQRGGGLAHVVGRLEREHPREAHEVAEARARAPPSRRPRRRSGRRRAASPACRGTPSRGSGRRSASLSRLWRRTGQVPSPSRSAAARRRRASGRRAASGRSGSRGRSPPRRRPSSTRRAPRKAGGPRSSSNSFDSCGWKPTAAYTPSNASAVSTARRWSSRSVAGDEDARDARVARARHEEPQLVGARRARRALHLAAVEDHREMAVRVRELDVIEERHQRSREPGGAGCRV